MDLSNQRFGDKYCAVLGEGVKEVPQVKVFKLKGNRISEKGAGGVLEAVIQNGKVIDLGSNNIGKLGCQHLAMSLAGQCWLEELSLEDNSLGD